MLIKGENTNVGLSEETIYAPEGWVLVKLEDIAANEKNAIVDGPFGSNLKNSDYVEDVKGVPVLTTKNLTKGYRTENLRYISLTKFEELKRSEVKGGDILVAKIGSCGKTGLYPQYMPSAIIPANLLKMTVHPIIERMYVYYFLNSLSFKRQLDLITTATAQPAFNVSKFRLLQIPLPPLSEQHRIVSAIEQQFTRLDAGVAALQRARAKLKRYRAAVLKAAVEGKLTETWRSEHPTTEPASLLLERILKERRARWEADLKTKGKDPSKVKYVEPAAPDIENLPELSEGWCWARAEQLISYLRNGLPQKPDTSPPGFRILRINAVRPMRVDLDEVRYLPLSEQEAKEYILVNGDLLFTRYNGSLDLLGVAGMVRDCSLPTLHPDKLIRVKTVLAGPLASYIEIASNVGISRKKLEAQARTTAGQTGISGSDIKNIPIPLPPLAEQEQIVLEVERRLSIITQLEAIVAANLKRAERLRQSILREAFAGRLVPQDPTDEPASVLLERIRNERNEHSKHNERNNQKNGVNHKNRFSQPSEPVSLDVTHTEQVALWSSNAN